MAREVLIVSASTGTGHAQAAEALRQAWTAADTDAAVQHVDLLRLAPSWVRAAYGNGYELIATRTPRLWRELYRRTDAPAPELARWGPVIHRTLFREFRRLLLSRRWDSCVCTHFLPGQLAAGAPGLPPFGMVITDLTLHHYWAQRRVSRYFVANRWLADDLTARVPGVRVEVTGIPVAPRFVDPPVRAEARAALGLDPWAPTVLVMGGGLGLGVAETTTSLMAAAVPNLQILAVCGRNESARQDLLRVRPGPGRPHVFGFVPDVERFIAASDLVVTKPGGLTTSEVLAVGRPLILTRAIPGHEEGNARVLTDVGAAIEAPTEEQVSSEVERVFGDRGLFDRLSSAAREAGRPRAAEAIVASLSQEAATLHAA